MATQRAHAPAWLFSFVDLAFLLLIAMTQLGGNGAPGVKSLGEIVVPKIYGDSAADLPAGSRERWQLRVHPRGEGDDEPFELVRPRAAPEQRAVARLAGPALKQRLAGIREEGESRPLLTPHGDSRSEDMLAAVGWIEEFWPGRRRATVEALVARR